MPALVNKTTAARSEYAQGNGLFASEALKPGELIIKVDNPYLSIVDEKGRKTRCYHCYLRLENPLTCGGCKTARYCSTACQRFSWRGIHKKECPILRRFHDQGRMLPTPTRLLLQALLKSPPGGARDEQLAGLLTHEVELLQRDVNGQRDEILLQARMAATCVGLPAAHLSKAASIFCQLTTNSFQVIPWDDDACGVCFDPLLSLVNHSCLPNTFMCFDSRSVSLVANRGLAKGEELFITYIDTTQNQATRQQELSYQFHFKCTCYKCAEDLDAYQTYLVNNYVLQAPESSFQAMEWEEAKKATASAVLVSSSVATKAELKDYNWKGLKELFLSTVLRSSKKPDGGLFLAVSPFPDLLRELTERYAATGSLAGALVLSLATAFRVTPFLDPEPWNPTRISLLKDVHKLLVYFLSPDPKVATNFDNLMKRLSVTAKPLRVLEITYSLMRLLERDVKDRGEYDSRLVEYLKSEKAKLLDFAREVDQHGLIVRLGAVDEKSECLSIWYTCKEYTSVEIVTKLLENVNPEDPEFQMKYMLD